MTELRNCVIFDLDGTLAVVDHRVHFIVRPSRPATAPYDLAWKPDWPSFNAAHVDDTPNAPIVEMYHALQDTLATDVVVCTGRFEHYHESTLAWFDKWHIWRPMILMMRAPDDHRPDTVIKAEMLQALRDQQFNPTLAVEDRKSVVAMWREAGLICAQVAEGDF
jgi:hypothetical protein